MIYRIDKTSKAHEVVASMPDFSDGHYYVKADADGWIQHTGKECPLPDGARYEVKNRDGEWGEGVVGKWVHGSYQREYDIIAYRPILDAEPSEPEAPEWDGESMPDKGARAVIAADGEEVVVMTHGRDNMVCVKDSEGYIGLFHCTELEPIRTPAQRAEDAMFDLFNQHAEITPGKARTLAVWASKAICDGKIPGVKLEDSQ